MTADQLQEILQAAARRLGENTAASAVFYSDEIGPSPRPDLRAWWDGKLVVGDKFLDWTTLSPEEGRRIVSAFLDR